MKKIKIISAFTIAILFITGLFSTTPVLAAKPSLNTTSLKLHIEQGYSLKIKGLDKKLTVKWSVGNKKIATVSVKGLVKGMASGNTVVYAKIFNKKKLKYSLKTNVLVDEKGYAVTQASFTRLLKNKKVSDIIVSGKTKFTVPKGVYGKNLECLGNSLSLKISDDSSLNIVNLSETKTAKIETLGQLSMLYAKKDNSKINLKSTGENALIHTIFLESPTTLNFVSDNSKEPCNIYVFKKSDIKISGENKNKDIIAINDTAEETKITASKNIELFVDARTTLVVNAGAKDSNITTLNYKTPIAVTNNTDSSLTITTPSVKKTVSAGETRTVTGKN